MWNFYNGFKVDGAEELGISTRHLEACMNDRTKQLAPVDYSYFGKTVSSGTVKVQTKIGAVRIDFKEKSGWIQSCTVERI